ncbi:MAG: DUF2934 domain-containing protein [Nitrospirae bacterium]|nr:DUF2934 domain-containing protein [Nitrospirota bacterium]
MKAQPAQERSVKTRPVVAVRAKSSAALTAPSNPSVSVCDDLQVLIAKRAHELYVDRGCRDGRALDDWLEAEREVLSQVPPV